MSVGTPSGSNVYLFFKLLFCPHLKCYLFNIGGGVFNVLQFSRKNIRRVETINENISFDVFLVVSYNWDWREY